MKASLLQLFHHVSLLVSTNVILLHLLFIHQETYAYSSHAGHCKSGDLKGKRSGHGEDGNGSLSNGSLQVKFDSIPLNPEGVFILNPDQEYTITLDFESVPIDSSYYFKGFLFRLSGINNENTNGVLFYHVSEDNDVIQQQDDHGCPDNISALTHTNSKKKKSVEFQLKFVDDRNVLLLDSANMLLEVTIVVERDANAWFYDAYNLQIDF